LDVPYQLQGRGSSRGLVQIDHDRDEAMGVMSLYHLASPSSHFGQVPARTLAPLGDVVVGGAVVVGGTIDYRQALVEHNCYYCRLSPLAESLG